MRIHKLVLAPNFHHIGHEVVGNPPDQLLAWIASEIKDGGNLRASAAWNADSLRWRLFHRYGPASVVLVDRKSDDFAVLSFGLVARGKLIAPVARILHLNATSMRSADGLLHSACQVGAELGVIEITATSVGGLADAALDRSGFGRYAVEPKTFTLCKSDPAAVWKFDALATDIGFEGIPRT